MLHHIHSNSLDRLTDSLIEQMSTTPAAVLQQQVVLVQNPGMKRWLQQALSRRHGIAANLDFPLPSRFIWDLFESVFGSEHNLRSWDASVLRWRLLAQLQQADPPAELAAYLAHDPRDVAALQLAERIAALFDQYQVYRPRMLRDWERGHRQADAAAGWQQQLWRALCAQPLQQHRAGLIDELIDRLQSGHALPQRLPPAIFVFAVASLSPLFLNVLLALAERIDVHVYHLNPSRHYWGDIESRREALKRGSSTSDDNELLASLGRQGREFLDLFYRDVRAYHELDLFVDIEPDSLLHRVQHEVLNLTRLKPLTDAPVDDSIQVVSCYSELRELQLLHDRILHWLNQDPGLQPHDIVVMSPDINALAPYIDAVFGEQPDNRLLPFTVSDHNPLVVSPLVQAILAWVRLPDSRLAASEVLGWLELPALQRAYGLQAEDVELIRYWVHANHVHWGLDGEFRRRHELGDDDRYSWQFGINRLLTAHCMSDDVELFADQLAADALPGRAGLEVIGRLQHLLDDLASWSERLTNRYPLDLWQDLINRLIDGLLRLDEDEEWHIKALRDELAGWREQAELAGFAGPVDYQVVHHLLQDAMARGSTHNQYLTGGINFCNLIPMRCLPFRVVCLIGMGEAHFPRNEAPLQFDLIARFPQQGDRARREDDRYMFLQSLLAAGDRFYLSYVGANQQDDSVLQPSVVVTELMDYVRETTGHPLAMETTPLQAFSPQNFIRGSYAAEWLVPANAPAPPPFAGRIEAAESSDTLELDELINFFQNPARYFLRHRLGLHLHEFEQSVEDDEVFLLDGLNRYQLNDRILRELLSHGRVRSENLLRSGALPEGHAGRLQLQRQIDEIGELYRGLVGDSIYSGGDSISGLLSLAGIELNGRVDTFSRQGLLQLQHSQVRGRHWFRLWIQHCFQCAVGESTLTRFYFTESKRIRCAELEPLSGNEARAHLDSLVELYRDGQQRILPLYPDSAYLYAHSKAATDESQALAELQRHWTDEDHVYFPEAGDGYLQTALKNSTEAGVPFTADFFALASRLFTPLLDSLEIHQ